MNRWCTPLGLELDGDRTYSNSPQNWQEGEGCILCSEANKSTYVSFYISWCLGFTYEHSEVLYSSALGHLSLFLTL